MMIVPSRSIERRRQQTRGDASLFAVSHEPSCIGIAAACGRQDHRRGPEPQGGQAAVQRGAGALAAGRKKSSRSRTPSLTDPSLSFRLNTQPPHTDPLCTPCLPLIPPPVCAEAARHLDHHRRGHGVRAERHVRRRAQPGRGHQYPAHCAGEFIISSILLILQSRANRMACSTSQLIIHQYLARFHLLSLRSCSSRASSC